MSGLRPKAVEARLRPGRMLMFSRSLSSHSKTGSNGTESSRLRPSPFEATNLLQDLPGLSGFGGISAAVPQIGELLAETPRIGLASDMGDGHACGDPDRAVAFDDPPLAKGDILGH